MAFTHDTREFFTALGPGRLLGLDVGEKTIGLALSDLTRTVATPYETIMRQKFSKDVQTLKELVEKQKICGIVAGDPINMDGTLGPRAQSVRQFAKDLTKQIDLPLLLWDERMSTMAVTRAMLSADLSRKRRDELVDKMAASYILQGALDALARLK
jgi:putative Holliday junction resolvase